MIRENLQKQNYFSSPPLWNHCAVPLCWWSDGYFPICIPTDEYGEICITPASIVALQNVEWWNMLQSESDPAVMVGTIRNPVPMSAVLRFLESRLIPALDWICHYRAAMEMRVHGSITLQMWRRPPLCQRTEIYSEEHDSSIFRQSSNPVCGSWKRRASSLWAKRHRAVPSWRNHLQGWRTVWICYWYALQNRYLPQKSQIICIILILCTTFDH